MPDQVATLRSGAEADIASAGAGTATNIHCAGVSFRTSSLAVRDRLALDTAAQSAILARLGCGHDARPASVSELVVLSTCNRTELYVAGAADARDVLPSLLADLTGVPLDEIAPATYVLTGEDAVRHLVRVTCGLESLAVGEPQILGQVADAFALSLRHAAAGPALSAIFRGAIRAGRRARAETGIGRHPVSVSSVAVRAVESFIPALAKARILIIGAGEMGALALAAIHHRGARDLTIMSRTQESAEDIAARFGARALTFERIIEALEAADVVISSTTAPHFIVNADMVRDVMARRADRKLLLMDIAVPRDIDPDASGIAGVTVVDLDSLHQHVASNVAERASEIPAVESIVEEETGITMRWLRQLDIAPLIAELRAHTDSIRRCVLERSARHFSHLPEDDRRRLDAFSASLVNALLHDLTTRLKADALEGDSAQYALALRHLFNLRS